MILCHWRGTETNCGDELNTLPWSALLPGFFDDDPAFRVPGIGPVIDARHPAAVTKLVARAACPPDAAAGRFLLAPARRIRLPP